jgi:heptosyltransferase-2
MESGAAARYRDPVPLQIAARRIFVRCPNWVGDMVMATAIFQSIRDAWPGAEITLSLRPQLEPILRGARYFDRLHFHPAKPRFGELKRLAADLARQQFDVAFVLPNSFETALVAAMARIPRRFGYALNGRGWLLTDRIRPPMRGFHRIPTPMPWYWADLVGLAGVEVRNTRPRLELDDETAHSFERWLEERGVARTDRLLLVAPGASFGSSKLWKSNRFAETIDELARREGFRAMIHFGPSERPIAEEIRSQCKTPVVLADDPPLDLHRLKAAARRCDLLICTDSGVRHYGVAFDRPVICIMGPNDPRYTAANLEKTTVVREEVDCGPCQLKLCPLDHRCMERIPSARVVDAAIRALAAAKS